MFKSKPIIILLAMGIMLIAESCVTNPQKTTLQQTKPGQSAYENCMKEKIKEFPAVSAEEARMTAHFICKMETGHMDSRYFDCLPITKQMFTTDGVSNVEVSAAEVCKYYAQACIESPQHAACSKNYIADEYQNNPNAPYPGTQIKRAKYGSTLLIDLVVSGSVDTAEAVIQRGANVNESMGGNWTPLAEARSKGNQEMVEMLMRYGAK